MKERDTVMKTMAGKQTAHTSAFRFILVLSTLLAMGCGSSNNNLPTPGPQQINTNFATCGDPASVGIGRTVVSGTFQMGLQAETEPDPPPGTFHFYQADENVASSVHWAKNSGIPVGPGSKVHHPLDGNLVEVGEYKFDWDDGFDRNGWAGVIVSNGVDESTLLFPGETYTFENDTVGCLHWGASFVIYHEPLLENEHDCNGDDCTLARFNFGSGLRVIYTP